MKRREQKVQELRRTEAKICKTCPETNYEKCLKCTIHIEVNKLLEETLDYVF